MFKSLGEGSRRESPLKRSTKDERNIGERIQGSLRVESFELEMHISNLSPSHGGLATSQGTKVTARITKIIVTTH